jgi:predicted transcriptional regulator
MTTKIELHDLVDKLPEEELATAMRFLEYLRDTHADPVLRALEEAPYDDEPLTDADIAAIEKGKADYRQGRFITSEEAKRRLLG